MPLIINDKRIDRISGSVGFSLLKPKKYIFDKLKNEGVRLPIIMMFGDVHNSADYQCETCNCSIKTKGCCMPVYSDEFLRILDSLATKENPVDFSMEEFKVGSKKLNDEKSLRERIEDKTTDSIPMKMFYKLFACYSKESRGTKLYSKYCPTKNIRWQFADTRHAVETKYNLEYSINNMYKKGLQELYELNNIPAKKVKSIINNYKISVGGDTVYKKIINFQILKIEDINKAVDYFFEIATPTNSLVMKQLYKLSSSLNIELWKGAMKSHLKYEKDYFQNKHGYRKSDIKSTRLEFYKLLLKDDYETLHSKLKNEYFKQNISKERTITQSDNAMFLDFYYVARTFKIPKGDVNPFLSLSYFGDHHRSNIFNLLVNILGYYEVVENIDKDYYNERSTMRCLDMSNTIDLNSVALEYGVDIRENARGYSNDNKRYVSSKHETPKYEKPKYVAPKYVAPKYVAHKYEKPKYVAPKYVAPKAPRKASPVKRKSSPRKSPAKKKSPVKRKSPPKKKSPVKRKSPAKKSPVKRKSPAKRTVKRKSPARKRR